MMIKKDITRAIQATGIRPLSREQKRIIAPIMEGRDCTAQTRPGVNEITAVLIAVLQTIDASAQTTQILIVTPTRESAQKISKIAVGLGRYKGIICNFCASPNPLLHDADRLRKGPHVVVGTHDRVLDMIHQGALDTRRISVFCLVEAETILARSRISVVELLLTLRSDCQFVMLAGSLSEEVVEATKWYMRKPARIELERAESQISDIRQYYITGGSKSWKLDALLGLWEKETITHAIVYCAHRSQLEQLAKQLQRANVRILVVRSEKEYDDQRLRITEFRYGARGLILSTHLLAPKLNDLQMCLVINYDMPRSTEDYISQVDDGGRCGTKRVSITFVRTQDFDFLREIEHFCEVEINEMPSDYRPRKIKLKKNGKISLVEWRKSRNDEF